MDLITTVSQITTVITDMLIILPLVSRDFRRKLFRVIITDLLYDIVSGNDGNTRQFVDTMRKIVYVYDDMTSSKRNVLEKDD